MTENIEVIHPGDIPDYKKNWRKITDQLPRLLVPPDWKDVFNSITVAWRDCGDETAERIRTFENALGLPNVPNLEKEDASLYLAITKKDWDKFAEGINGIVNGVKFKWQQMRDLSGLADRVKDTNSAGDIQSITLLQAISETHKEGRTSEWIRQRVAQHAFEEMINTGVYRAIDYSGPNNWVNDRTTQDDFNTEKDELISALNSDLWDEKTLEERTKDYKNLRKIILKGDNSVSEEMADPLEDLWGAANGKGVTRKSALRYLQLTEDVYNELEDGGAFDVSLLEEDEE